MAVKYISYNCRVKLMCLSIQTMSKLFSNIASAMTWELSSRSPRHFETQLSRFLLRQWIENTNPRESLSREIGGSWSSGDGLSSYSHSGCWSRSPKVCSRSGIRGSNQAGVGWWDELGGRKSWWKWCGCRCTNILLFIQLVKGLKFRHDFRFFEYPISPDMDLHTCSPKIHVITLQDRSFCSTSISMSTYIACCSPLARFGRKFIGREIHELEH